MEPLISIVDDDIFFQNYISAFLRQHNFNRVISYSTGEMCLANIDKRPDLIILDHDMNGLSGTDVLKEMNRQANVFDVIMVSSRDDEDLIQSVVKLGVKKYIKKDNELQKNLKEYFSNINSHKVSIT
ncbi:MAG: hypothetical protein AUJ98_04490 [Bacteroidetes bacterium CG2_30_33_31]|nr:MAG: hypothetical protein AUJ98_04490 [Bacteroidetes bacterium CG2_30_33_31]